jgi:hypothetical protein
MTSPSCASAGTYLNAAVVLTGIIAGLWAQAARGDDTLPATSIVCSASLSHGIAHCGCGTTSGEVEKLANAEAIVVRVTDRDPYVARRIIALSLAAAERPALARPSIIGRVRLSVLAYGNARATTYTIAR